MAYGAVSVPYVESFCRFEICQFRTLLTMDPGNIFIRCEVWATTPATSVISDAAFLPFNGRSTTRDSSMTWDRVPVVVSTCGTSPETLTTCVCEPTFRLTLRVSAWSA